MVEENTEETQEKETEKKFSKEDIDKAKDANSLLETYRALRTNPKINAGELQMKVAERFGELDEPDKSFQFTLLAEQTKNFDKLGNVVHALGDSAHTIQGSSYKMGESAESISRSSKMMINASENMRQASARMGNR